MNVTRIHYFDRVVDEIALANFKKTAEYDAAVAECKGDWAFSHYQDKLRDRFTRFVPVLKHRGDVAIDYITISKHAITGFIRDSVNVPVIRFKFDTAKLGIGRRLTSEEKSLLDEVIREYKISDISLPRS